MGPEHCHHCGYDLTGLAKRGVCPECGRRYDTTRRYHADRRDEPFILRHIKALGLGVLALLILIGGGALSMASTKPMGVVILTMVIAAVPALGAVVYGWADWQQQQREEGED